MKWNVQCEGKKQREAALSQLCSDCCLCVCVRVCKADAILLISVHIHPSAAQILPKGRRGEPSSPPPHASTGQEVPEPSEVLARVGPDA